MVSLSHVSLPAAGTKNRSLANENSDTWVVEQLGEELMSQFRRLGEEQRLGWTQIMDRQMRSLWEKGVSDRATEIPQPRGGPTTSNFQGLTSLR